MEQVPDAEADVQLVLEEGFAQGDFPDYILVEASLSPVGRTSVAAGELQGEVQGQVHRRVELGAVADAFHSSGFI